MAFIFCCFRTEIGNLQFTLDRAIKMENALGSFTDHFDLFLIMVSVKTSVLLLAWNERSIHHGT